MAAIITYEEIKSLVPSVDVVAAMEEGFKEYSNGNTVVPPVGELLLDKGDTHIKYGFIKEDDYYVVKIASGFPGNAALGLSTSQGMMLLFDQHTGETIAVLLDGGHLTDLRTAAAGALAAKYFAPKELKGIGIVGTGIQARLQLEYLLKDNTCDNIWLWGRTAEHANNFVEYMKPSCTVQVASSTKELAEQCNLIVTTTPSKEALLSADDIQVGTHITAVGSDTAEKQELDEAILAKADIVVADSIPQSKSRGEIYQAVSKGAIQETKVVELGAAIQEPSLQRVNDGQITIVDLTGVAVQDIMISKAVYEVYQNRAQK